VFVGFERKFDKIFLVLSVSVFRNDNNTIAYQCPFKFVGAGKF
jgi:hypothetical protein